MRKRLLLGNSSWRIQHDVQRMHTISISFIVQSGSLWEWKDHHCSSLQNWSNPKAACARVCQSHGGIWPSLKDGMCKKNKAGRINCSLDSDGKWMGAQGGRRALIELGFIKDWEWNTQAEPNKGGSCANKEETHKIWRRSPENVGAGGEGVPQTSGAHYLFVRSSILHTLYSLFHPLGLALTIQNPPFTVWKQVARSRHPEMLLPNWKVPPVSSQLWWPLKGHIFLCHYSIPHVWKVSYIKHHSASGIFPKSPDPS